MVEQLLAAGANGAEAADDGSTPRSIAQDDEVLAMFVPAQRLRSLAFAMGLQERLGAASVVRGLDPELLRMLVELVDDVPEAEGEISPESSFEVGYPPVDNGLESEVEINSDSDSEVDEFGESDEEGGGGEEEGGGGGSDA